MGSAIWSCGRENERRRGGNGDRKLDWPNGAAWEISSEAHTQRAQAIATARDSHGPAFADDESGARTAVPMGAARIRRLAHCQESRAGSARASNPARTSQRKFEKR